MHDCYDERGQVDKMLSPEEWEAKTRRMSDAPGRELEPPAESDGFDFDRGVEETNKRWMEVLHDSWLDGELTLGCVASILRRADLMDVERLEEGGFLG